MNELILLGLLAAAHHGVRPVSMHDTTRAVSSADSPALDSVAPPALELRRAASAGAPRQQLVLGIAPPIMRFGIVPNLPGPTDSAQQRRPRAIAYSEWYGRRLTLHRVGSYAMLPLFAGEYWLGNKLTNDLELASWVRPAHVTVASTLGVLFAVNTVTGVWNLWDARHDPNDRTRRTIHAALMLAADAGMVWTASLAGDEEGGTVAESSRQHRNAALVSIGVGTLGTVMMWLWKK
jgi:hypothetical protein